ncbi:MAG: UDP-N-acetylglucosamine 2-epimerase (non-hydrolyzing) [Candidatus Wallbacteria bacterium]|nr:UDP-N-acetylglucosamine 2-epimerase (non-hydrolyzing) [Candidatus Wallbacteria bacterium]
MKKILTVVGARPQFIKSFAISLPIMTEFADRFSEVLVHTGQHYDHELSGVFFEEMKLPEPKYNLEIGSNSPGKQVGLMLIELEKVMQAEKPDLVLTYGDTNSTMAAALCAAKLYIPLAHIEAGVRSFFYQMPEEINRIVTDKVADFLFTPTETGVTNLSREFLRGEIVNSGDVMLDVFQGFFQRLNIEKTDKGYILFTLHREINTSRDNLEIIAGFLARVGQNLIWPLHPRAKKYLTEFGLLPKITANPRVSLIEPVSYLEMMKYLSGANRVVTDSGGLVKEAYFMGKPCLTMREETEWPETLAGGWNSLVGMDPGRIIDGLKQIPEGKCAIGQFGDGQAARKILEYLNGRI